MNKLIGLLGLIAIAIAVVAIPTAVTYKDAAETAKTNYDNLVEQAQANYEGYNIVKATNTNNVAKIDTLTNNIDRLNNNITNLDTDVQRLTGDIDTQHKTIAKQSENILILQKHAKVYFHGVDSLRRVSEDQDKVNKIITDIGIKQAAEIEELKLALKIAHAKEADHKKIFGTN